MIEAAAPAIPATPPARPVPDGEIDIGRLIQPIPGPSPAGVSLRYEPEYDRIREARRDEDPNLPQGVWRRDVKRADWNLVVDLCADALSERSKDLQIACWLVEALVYRDGFVGVVEGLRIFVALCDGFWPDLFPAIDGGDIGARLMTIEWLNEKVAQAIYTLPLTRPGTTEAISYSWTDYVNAQRRDMAHGGDTNTATIEAVLASVAATPTSFYEELREQLGRGLAHTESLRASLNRCCGGEEPGLGQIRDALSNIAGFVDAALAQRKDTRKLPVPANPMPSAPDDALPPATDLANAAVGDPTPPSRIQIRSREEAYRLLMEIADYLFVVEPHSPTPYIVQRAASWGMMPLHKLLVELTRGSNDLAVLFELLGMGGDGEAKGDRRRD